MSSRDCHGCYFAAQPLTGRGPLVSFSLHQTPAQTPRSLDVRSSTRWDSLSTGSRLLSDRRSSLLTASRSTVWVRFNLTFNLGSRSVADRVTVVDSVDGILLAWYVARDLGLLPDDYPTPLPLHATAVHSQVSNTSWDWSTDVDQATPAQHARAQTQLLAEFSDVLRDPADFAEEDVLPPMRGPPMNIHLVDNAYTVLQERGTTAALCLAC